MRPCQLLCLTVALVAQGVAAEPRIHCQPTVEVTDSATREVHRFRGDGTQFDVPLHGLSGFTKCTVPPPKDFEHNGSTAKRVEMVCFTSNGAAVVAQAMYVVPHTADVTRFVLLGRPAQVRAGSGSYEYNASGAREILVWCE